MTRKKQEKSEILRVSLPRHLAQEATRVASRAGLSRDEFYQRVLEQYLWLREWQKLQAYGFQQALKLGLRPDDVQRLIDEYRQEKSPAGLSN